jgi:hypothetical protein
MLSKNSFALKKIKKTCTLQEKFAKLAVSVLPTAINSAMKHDIKF